MTSNADMKTMTKRPLWIALAACGIFLLLFGIASCIILSSGLQPLFVEAGESMPQAEDFLRAPYYPLSVKTDLTDEEFARVGEHTVTFTFLGIPCRTTLTVQDTTPPAFTVKDHGARLGDTVSWEDFVSNVTDFSACTGEWTGPEEISAPGEYPVTVRLTDGWGNTAEQNASLFVFSLPESLTLEAGASAHVCAKQLEKSVPGASFAEDVDTSLVGEMTTEILLDGFRIPIRLDIRDTQPPVAITYRYHFEISADLEQDPLPSYFLAEVSDASEVSISYEGTPDFHKPGTRKLVLVLTDAANNVSRVECQVTVTAGKTSEPVTPQKNDLPVISGVKKLKVNVGMWISYTSGVSARDADGNKITVKVDSSAVKRNVPGEYRVIYTATDKKGRVATVRTTVTVCEITEEILKPYVDKVLGKILKKDMTQRQQARAIYDWMTANVSYTAYTSKDHWRRAAYYGFVNGRGDCYVYYAMSRALLDGAGIQNMEICRDNPSKPHYWNLINCGDGWYHFDTCPHYKDYPLESFMLTDREVEEYSKKCVKDYYSFDESLYPATP